MEAVYKVRRMPGAPNLWCVMNVNTFKVVFGHVFRQECDFEAKKWNEWERNQRNEIQRKGN